MANTFYYVAWRTFTLCTYHIHFPITLFLFLFFENNGRWYWVIYRMGLGGEGLSQDLLSNLCLLLALCLAERRRRILIGFVWTTAGIIAMSLEP